MELTIDLGIIMGTIVSLLLSVIAWFIRQLHADFRKMEQDVIEVKTNTQLIKSEFKSNYDLLSQRVSFIERQIRRFEPLEFRRNPHRKSRD